MLKRTLSQVFLLGLIAAMAAVFIATRSNPAQDMVLSVTAIALIALSLGMERLFPLHTDWNKDQGETSGDVTSFIVIFGILDGALKFLMPFLILTFLPDVQIGLALPFWTEVALVMLLIEFGAWVSHWAHHRYPRLWAFHAMHHSPERLYTLNNFRFHPLNHIATYVLAFTPPLLLGFSQDALLAYAALTLPIVLFQHSNIRFDFGVLNYLFNTNELHRWHHSAAAKEGTKNLGRALVIWDQVFGTFLAPARRSEPKSIGLFFASRSYPKAHHLLRQITWHFCKTCCA